MDCQLIPEHLRHEINMIVDHLNEKIQEGKKGWEYYITGSIALCLYLCEFNITTKLADDRNISDIDIALKIEDTSDLSSFGRFFSKLGYKWRDGPPIKLNRPSFVMYKNVDGHRVTLDLFLQGRELAPEMKQDNVYMSYNKIPILIPSELILLKEDAVQKKPGELKHQYDLSLLYIVSQKFNELVKFKFITKTH
jgi:hypothetical protein